MDELGHMLYFLLQYNVLESHLNLEPEYINIVLYLKEEEKGVLLYFFQVIF